MSTVENPYRSWGMVAADAPVNERAGFIRSTYLHLAGAVLAFLALCAAIQTTPLGATIAQFALASRWGWFVVLGAFVGVSWIAERWARSDAGAGTQYLGLGLYVVAEAVIFAPLLFVAELFEQQLGANVVPLAGGLTLLVFAGLTAIVFMTGADFSFLRSALMVGALVALVVALAGAIFGFNLGLFFIGALLLLASGYILYDTSNVLHHYRVGQHVAASLALFASVALLFWYMIQLVMRLQSRD